jgi:monoamine oxidase
MQYTKFGGIEGRKEGEVHFAGEHTSVDFQGYLTPSSRPASAPHGRFWPT